MRSRGVDLGAGVGVGGRNAVVITYKKQVLMDEAACHFHVMSITGVNVQALCY